MPQGSVGSFFFLLAQCFLTYMLVQCPMSCTTQSRWRRQVLLKQCHHSFASLFFIGNEINWLIYLPNSLILFCILWKTNLTSIFSISYMPNTAIHKTGATLERARKLLYHSGVTSSTPRSFLYNKGTRPQKIENQRIENTKMKRHISNP